MQQFWINIGISAVGGLLIGFNLYRIAKRDND